MTVTFLVIWYAVFNLLSFCLMGIDKHRARHNRWRVSESSLILFAYLGGAIGFIAGMKIFHHKTRKWYFYLNFVLSLLLHGVLIYLSVRYLIG